MFSGQCTVLESCIRIFASNAVPLTNTFNGLSGLVPNYGYKSTKHTHEHTEAQHSLNLNLELYNCNKVKKIL